MESKKWKMEDWKKTYIQAGAEKLFVNCGGNEDVFRGHLSRCLPAGIFLEKCEITRASDGKSITTVKLLLTHNHETAESDHVEFEPHLISTQSHASAARPV